LRLGLAAVALVAQLPILRPTPFRLSDHPIFIEAGRLVLSGRSPYDPAVWDELATRIDSPYVAMLNATTGVWPHPPWVAYAFAPLAVLPGDIAYWALHLVLAAAGVAGALVLVERVVWPSEPLHALALVVALTFQPLVIGIRWGQLGPLLVLGVALLVAGLDTRRSWRIVAAALLLLLKPHVLVLLAVVAAVLVARRVPRAIVPAAVTIAVACGIPTLLHPEWLSAATAGYGARVDAIAAYATTYALALDLAPATWPAVAAATSAVALAACGAAVRTARGTRDLLWPVAAAAVASLAFAPYLWTTDQGPLVAIAVLSIGAVGASSPGIRAAHLVLTVVAVTALPWALFLISAPRPTQALAALVPFVFALLLLQAARVASQRAAGSASSMSITGMPSRTG
jgi:hypothetical protein